MILNYVYGDNMKNIFLLGSLVVFVSCGIKGPPLPPLQEETIQSQKNWDDIQKATQPAPGAPAPKKVLNKKKKVVPDEH